MIHEQFDPTLLDPQARVQKTMKITIQHLTKIEMDLRPLLESSSMRQRLTHFQFHVGEEGGKKVSESNNM